MLQSILVALDETEASATAQDLALNWAARVGAEVSGFAVLDRAYITAPMAVGIGGSAYKEHRDKVKLEEAREFLVRIEQQFRSICETRQCKWQLIEAEGIPYQLLEEESQRHDLIITGRDTDFHFDESAHVTSVVHRLLRDNPRPLVICPELPASLEGPILATTDGSDRSARALHMLALLCRGGRRGVHVLAIDHDLAKAEHMARYASAIFEKHGLQVAHEGVGAKTEPSEVIVEHQSRLGASMIAIGAAGTRSLHDLLLGSTTQHLLDVLPCPLFVHH